MNQAPRYRFISWWSDLVSRRPWAVLMIFGVVSLAAVILTAMRLEFQSDRNALISPGLTWNRTYIDWTESFQGTHDLTVVVDPDPNNEGLNEDRLAQAEAFVEDLGRQMEQNPDVFKRVFWGFDRREVSPRAIRLLPRHDFDRDVARLAEARPLLAAPSPQSFISNVVGAMRAQQDAPAEADANLEQITGGLNQLAQLVGGIAEVVSNPEGPSLPERMAPDEAGHWDYLTTRNGRLLFIRVTPKLDADMLNQFLPSMSLTRQLIAETLPRYPLINAGLTGIDVIEADETDAAAWDSTFTSIIAFTVIFGLMIAAFHSFRTPLMGMAALLFGVAISFGYVTLAVGHLQVISVIFTVLLLGLGVDYGIHLAARYEMIRRDYPDGREGFVDAMRDTFVTMGPGIATGAITTAGAFLMTMFTDFTGVAEMGHIAAVGVLICLLVMFTVFPALLALFKRDGSQIVPLQERTFCLYRGAWWMPFVRHPRTTLLVSGVIVLLSLLAISRMRFDYNLFNMLPRGVESVAWQEVVNVKADQSIYFGVSVVDNLDEARERTKAFRALPTVSEVGGVGMLFPPDDEERVAAIEAVKTELNPLVEAALRPSQAPSDDAAQPDLVAQLNQLRLLFVLAARVDIPEPLREPIANLRQEIERAQAALASLAPEERAARLEVVQRQYDAWRSGVARQLASIFDTSSLTPADLPPAIIDVYQSVDGRLAIELLPSVSDDPATRAEGPLEPTFMKRFIREMRSVDPDITGVIVQVYESGDLIRRSYQRAGLWALALVFVLVWIDFRSIRDALLTLVPVALGFAVTFGVMWIAGMQINPANIIVLPLMFGIGVDAGVHMIHRWRMDPTGRPLGLTEGTGKGVTVTSLATVVGFGSLMLAHHRGIASLGFVLAVGLTMTLLACLIVMPAALELIAKRRDRREGRANG